MSSSIMQMTKAELKNFIEVTIEHKLRELLADPDEGLELKRTVAVRLRRQKKMVEKGVRGKPFEHVMLKNNL